MDDAGAQDFRAAFPVLARLIDGTGQHIVQVTCSLAGNRIVVIVKRTDNNRGWGLAWFTDARELRGMRGLVYRADESEFDPDNTAFIAEMGRRLSVIGASLYAVEGGADYMRFCSDTFARGNAKKSRRIPPKRQVQEQLRAHAF